mmetsp:Transcript_11193/g.34047  ORF Transcript_11193/g.34047 Transcript_11193/m.34047 type:complete len:896 (+) Transcript_11193:871-3558(+)
MRVPGQAVRQGVAQHDEHLAVVHPGERVALVRGHVEVLLLLEVAAELDVRAGHDVVDVNGDLLVYVLVAEALEPHDDALEVEVRVAAVNGELVGDAAAALEAVLQRAREHDAAGLQDQRPGVLRRRREHLEVEVVVGGRRVADLELRDLPRLRRHVGVAHVVAAVDAQAVSLAGDGAGLVRAVAPPRERLEERRAVDGVEQHLRHEGVPGVVVREREAHLERRRPLVALGAPRLELELQLEVALNADGGAGGGELDAKAGADGALNTNGAGKAMGLGARRLGAVAVDGAAAAPADAAKAGVAVGLGVGRRAQQRHALGGVVAHVVNVFEHGAPAVDAVLDARGVDAALVVGLEAELEVRDDDVLDVVDAAPEDGLAAVRRLGLPGERRAEHGAAGALVVGDAVDAAELEVQAHAQDHGALARVDVIVGGAGGLVVLRGLHREVEAVLVLLGALPRHLELAVDTGLYFQDLEALVGGDGADAGRRLHVDAGVDARPSARLLGVRGRHGDARRRAGDVGVRREAAAAGGVVEDHERQALREVHAEAVAEELVALDEELLLGGDGVLPAVGEGRAHAARVRREDVGRARNEALRDRAALHDGALAEDLRRLLLQHELAARGALGGLHEVVLQRDVARDVVAESRVAEVLLHLHREVVAVPGLDDAVVRAAAEEGGVRVQRDDGLRVVDEFPHRRRELLEVRLLALQVHALEVGARVVAAHAGDGVHLLHRNGHVHGGQRVVHRRRLLPDGVHEAVALGAELQEHAPEVPVAQAAGDGHRGLRGRHVREVHERHVRGNVHDGDHRGVRVRDGLEGVVPQRGHDVEAAADDDGYLVVAVGVRLGALRVAADACGERHRADLDALGAAAHAEAQGVLHEDAPLGDEGGRVEDADAHGVEVT